MQCLFIRRLAERGQQEKKKQFVVCIHLLVVKIVGIFYHSQSLFYFFFTVSFCPLHLISSGMKGFFFFM
jgi:NADH:ubiquinone oxidoreductase subunit 4 (subunit M)